MLDLALNFVFKHFGFLDTDTLNATETDLAEKLFVSNEGLLWSGRIVPDLHNFGSALIQYISLKRRARKTKK